MFQYLKSEFQELLGLGLTEEEIEGWLEFFYTRGKND